MRQTQTARIHTRKSNRTAAPYGDALDEHTLTDPLVALGQPQTVQRRTKVSYEYDLLSHEDTANLGQSKYARVGQNTIAHLDPADPQQGSAPGSGAAFQLYDILNQYTGEPFVKGHLLNAHLGGLGVPENLFPITSRANALHKEYEYHAKSALLSQTQEMRRGNSYDHVRYQVEAQDRSNDPSGWFEEDPAARLTINLAYVRPNGSVTKHLIQNARINSEPSSSDRTFNKTLARRGWGSFGTGKPHGVAKANANKIKTDTNFKSWYSAGIDGGYVQGNRVLATVE